MKKNEEETEEKKQKKKNEEEMKKILMGEDHKVTSSVLDIAAFTVLRKISNLQNEMSVLSSEDQIAQILKHLRDIRKPDRYVFNNEQVRGIVYDLEEVIDELLITSVQTRNMAIFIGYLSTFVDLPKELFHVLAVVDLIRYYELRKLFEHKNFGISLDIPYSNLFSRRGRIRIVTWQRESSFPIFNLSLGSTIIVPVKSKLDVLSVHKQLSPSSRKQAMWLRDEFTSLEPSLQDVDSRRRSEEEIAWIDELCDVCRSAENVADLFIDEQQLLQKRKQPFKNRVWAPHNFISQRKLAQQMSRIKDKICSISSSRPHILTQISSSVSSVHAQTPSYPCTAEQLNITSFDEDVDAVTAMLLKDDPRCLTISIVGIIGIGKTSLAKLIYESQAIADHFPHRIWLSGARVEDILKQVLCADKKYLIVVNDSYADSFSEISYAKPLKDISNGTRIIFTLRGLHEAPGDDQTNFIYRLHLRSNVESWALFTHTMKMNIPSKLEEKLKKDILSKCGGLPKVIVKLGELLSQANLDEWPKLLEQFIQDEEPWSEVLQKINEDLPLYLRRCLFHFGLFPVGFKIPARRVTALWIAEGLRGHQDDVRSPEQIAELCLRELVNCNMVQMIVKKLDDKIKTCCLPEALRLHWFSRAQQINNKIRVARYLTDQNDAIFNHIHGKNAIVPSSCYRDINSFSSFDTREEGGEYVGNFLDRCISCNCFRFLWILDLEHVYKPKLPKAIDQLTQLRYLGLRWTYLEALPMFIGRLLNLQTLDLKGTCINILPSSIWMMQNLINLLLDERSRSMFVPQQDKISLVNLQTLRGVCIDEDTPVRNGLDTLLKIRKLGLKCRVSVPSQKAAMSSQQINVANWVKNLKHLQYLKLKSFDERGQPWDLKLESLSAHLDLSSIYLVGKLKNQHLISQLPKNLIDITLSVSGLADDPMQKLAKLGNLRIVRLFAKSFTGKKMLCCCGGFCKLEVLKFWELEHLEEWNVEEGALPSLKSLEIRRCGNLKIIPDGLRNVKTLREVTLRGVPMLSSRIKKNEGEDWSKIAHVRHIYIADSSEHMSNQTDENKGI